MDIRPSAIAGVWYPDDPVVLNQSIESYLGQAHSIPPPGKVWGIIAPHAGYEYSGQVAAHAFKCLAEEQPGLVVVVSPLHYNHPDPLLTTTHQAYQTPLGSIPVNRSALIELSHTLYRRTGFGLTPIRHDPEHALEIELPFLQYLFDEFQLLPIMVRDQRLPVVKMLGETLADVLRYQSVLFVASSDLSHFHPRPTACQLDAEILRRIEAFDPQAVLEAEDEGVGFACGRGAIAAVLWATQALGANRVKVLHHATSGDVTSDYHSVVGYGAAVIWESTEEDE